MRFSEFFVEEAYLKPATFADGTLRLSKHLQDRSTQRDIPMTNIMRVLQRLEAVRGKDLAALPPTSFIVKTPDNFELAIIKTQSLTTNKVEYIVATVRQRLRPGAGQRIIYLEDELDEESKTLDPDLYGEMLPTATVKRIVNTVMSQVDPSAKVTIKQSPEGYYIVRSEGLRLDFGITADGGDITANIVNAYSSYKGAGVVTRIFSECFRAAEQLWGKPNRFVMSAHEDRGHGVWQHIAQKLGAEWEGSISEADVDEGWKSALAGAAATGAMAFGGAGAADAKPAPTKPVVTAKATKSTPKPAHVPVSKQAQANMTPIQKLKTAASANGIHGTELAQFLAQCAHESANFTRMEEIGNANYFAKKYDPKHAPKTARILGNTEVGDGERYKGRGFIQLTGRENYRRAGKALNLPLETNPDLAARPDVAAVVAVWYWKTRVANKVKNFSNTKQATRAINPAMKGIADRQEKFKQYQVAMR